MSLKRDLFVGLVIGLVLMFLENLLEIRLASTTDEVVRNSIAQGWEDILDAVDFCHSPKK